MEPIPIIAWNRLFSFLNGSEFHIGTVVLFEAKIHAPGIRLEPKIRRYTSSKYSVTGKKRRRCEFFTTGCASCRKKRPIDFFEASCGACAPRSVRKRGNPREAPCFRTLRHRHSQARRSWNSPRLQVNINVYTTFRLTIKNRLEGVEHKACIFRPEIFLFLM